MFPARIIAIAALRTARPAVHCSYRYQRSFSVTPAPRAAENPDAFITAFQNTSLFKKLADKPDALVALEQFAKLLQSSGLDLTSGKPPSTMQMIKLASNSEFREGAKRVMEEMQKAGIDFKSKELMDEIMSLKKTGGSGG